MTCSSGQLWAARGLAGLLGLSSAVRPFSHKDKIMDSVCDP